MRRGVVYYRDIPAAKLVENGGYTLTYEPSYLATTYPAISVLLPKRAKAYESKYLFPFFSGLLTEGVNEDLECRYLKLDRDDEFGRLIRTSKNDCIGAFYVKEEK